jgi:hypothetical protein
LKFFYLGSCHDVYNAASTLGSELNGSGGKCKQSVVFATANVGTGVKVGSALTHDDFA